MESPSENGAHLSAPIVDSQAKEPSVFMLPPEILSLVSGFLSKRQLKRVRKVSKTWERAAVPYLFDEIYMSLNMADLRIAKLMILQFKQYIRTLIFSSACYTDMDRENFDKALSYEGSDMETDSDIGYSEHSFKLYRMARKNQEKNLKTGLVSAYLSFALTSCPKIRKIILTDLPSSRSMSRKSLKVFEPRRSKICLFEGCVLEDNDHFPSAVRQSGFLRSSSRNPWRLILQALSVTDSNVSELTMVPENNETMMDTSAFSMSSGELSQAKICFHALTKFRLTFAWDCEQFSTDVDVRYIHRNVAKLLRRAVNLECLALIALEEHEPVAYQNCPLHAILRKCTFPKLKSLIIGFFEFTEVELLSLLTHSKRIQQLTIECSILREGSWVRIVDWARASLLSLKNAQFNQLYGGFEDPWADTEYMDVYGHVGEFLFAHGGNPFTVDALAKYHADRDAGRTRIDPCGGEIYTDICDRYH